MKVLASSILLLLLFSCGNKPFYPNTEFSVDGSKYRFGTYWQIGGYVVEEEVVYQDGTRNWVPAKDYVPTETKKKK